MTDVPELPTSPEDLEPITPSSVEGIVSVQNKISRSVAVLTGLFQSLTLGQSKQIKNLRRIAFVLVVVVVLLAGLSVRAFLNVQEIQRNSATLELHQVYLEEVLGRRSTEALCPLYDLFLDSYDPEAAAKRDPDFNRKEYEDAFTVIEEGSKALGCVHITRGKD